jgi:two-component system chemotaxis sensor kinase CheA
MGRREELKRELMTIFRAELEEHCGTLNKGLLALEEGLPEAERDALLADLMRALHSLKGAARTVKLQDIATVAHRLEDVLGAVRRAELIPTSELFDLLLPALDSLQEMADAHLRGEPLPAEKREQLLVGLEAVLRGDVETGRSGDGETGRQVPPPRPAAPASPAEDTIRVATAGLDVLMDDMGELMVTRLRSEQRLAEFRTLQQRIAHWEKSWRQARLHYTRLRRRNSRRAEVDPGQAQGGRQDAGLWQAHDIVPLLDFLDLNEAYLKDIGAQVSELAHSFGSDCGRLIFLTDDLQDRIRRLRMLPIATLFDVFPRMVRDLARERGREVVLRIEGAETEVDRRVLEALKDPLTHLLRNAVDHAIEPPDQREAAGKPRRGTVHLRAAQKGNTVVLEVADDGTGVDLQAVRQAAVARGLLTEQEAASLNEREAIHLIFRSGLSTMPRATELSGRGVGLDVVRENLERLHGLIQVDTAPGEGTTFTLTVPLTLATSHVLLVGVGGQTVAVPTTTVERILKVDGTAVGRVEGRPAIRANGQPLPLFSLAQVLELPRAEPRLTPDQRMPVIVLGVAERRVAFRVGELQGIHEVVVKSLGPQLKSVRNVAGATILGTGQVVVILSVADVVKSALAGTTFAASPPVGAREVRRRVLVVDDSITTRTLEKNILENAGYQVLVAADGEDAWALVQSEPLDAVAADIAMPRMDGFILTEKIKGDERFRELPVVLVTSLEAPEDKIRGLKAGADAYITKGTFDQQDLLETIERLIG